MEITNKLQATNTMPINFKSTRYKRQYIDTIKRLWLDNPDKPPLKVERLYWHYVDNVAIPLKMVDEFIDEVSDFMVDFLQKRYEALLNEKKITLQRIEQLLINQIDEVYNRMFSLIEIWVLTYKGPAPQLSDINKPQSVHVSFVERQSRDGINILKSVSVPRNQQTLSEIQTVWLTKYGSATNKVIADMKEWGSRKTVMGDSENVYRLVLRGLWAKIKESHTLKDELITRLWEECNEALEMCADGHVARLVNVMVGFDDKFGNILSPKEYFQNNIALISNSDAPHAFKMEHASRLMDEINMPTEERAAWLEAL